MPRRKTKYVLVCHQAGEGCDYSIGCGVNYRYLEAETREDAIKESMKFFHPDGEYSFDRDKERCLDSAFVAEVICNLNAQTIGEAQVADRKKREAEELEQNERAEYNRLREKFEGQK